MQDLIQALLTGLALGSVFALIALGYTLVYGIIELINFAHGDLFMLTSFAALTVLEAFAIGRGSPLGTKVGALFLALLVAMLFGAVVNVLIERLAYRRLRNAPRLTPLISAIGMSFILIQIGQYWKGSRPLDVPRVINRLDLLGPLDIGVRFFLRDLILILVTIPILLGLLYVVNRTRIGKAMRATAQDRDASALMGIDINRTIAFAFLLGGALAGAAGVMYGQYTLTTDYQRGFETGLKAFTAAVLGGIGNLNGAVLGGLLIGIIQAMSERFLQNGSAWANAVIFAILITILVFRPSGLLGEQTPDKA
ncbi:MAG: branched-chain amino acid ABC transporter permease [Chloroflexota bacterium]|nr:branched-chain amino acid ABC transporter permease [Chloroflexota bacterium]